MSEQPLSEFDSWVNSLYDETYDVEIMGRKFTFKRHYPNSINDQIKGMDGFAQKRFLIAYCSVNPKLTVNQVAHLPDDIIAVIMAAEAFQKASILEQIKKILPQEMQTEKKS